MDYEKIICTIYDYLYAKVYQVKHFKLDLSMANQKQMIGSFIELLARQYNLQSVGHDVLIEYICFQFSRFTSMNTNRRISLGWIIGKKNFPRWLNKTKEQQFYADQFVAKYNIDIYALRQTLVEDQIIHEGLDVSEELEKVRFEGQAQLYHCSIYTTLYNHLSKNCMLCSIKSDCKKLLSQINITLYHKRGYQ